MRRLWCLFIAFALSYTSAYAQDLSLFGYFETQIMGISLKDNFYQMNTQKLRLDLKSSPDKHVKFGANFDFVTYSGKTNWDMLDFLPESIVRIIPEQLKPFYVMPYSNRSFLDNAFVELSFGKMDITAGRQQISLGTGYAWNPLDIFNINNLLDPTYEKPGHDAVRVDITLGRRTTLSGIYSPGKDWNYSTRLVQFSGALSHFDFSLLAAKTTWQFHDYSTPVMTAPDYGFLSVPEQRSIAGFSTAGQIFGLGVWAEYGYNWMESTKDFYELVAGTDYTFESGTYVMAEFYRNTLCSADKNNYTLNDWIRFYTGEQKAVGRDQLYLFIQHPASDLINIGLSSIICLNDRSFMLLPSISYNIFENVELTGYANIYLGEDKTVFRKDMGSGGLLRMRYYF